MRAGDDQHRHRADDRFIEVTDAPPHQERGKARGSGDVEEERGGPVGEGLGTAAARLGFGNEALDARESGVVTDGDDTAMAESVATVPATTRSSTPRCTGRDSPVIIDSSMSRGAFDHRAVGGDRGTGSDEHNVIGTELLQTYCGQGPVALDALCLVRQERGERALGLADGVHPSASGPAA